MFLKLKKKIYQEKNGKAGIIKTVITTPLAVHDMLELIIKYWRRSLRPWWGKMIKIRKDLKNIEKIANVLKKRLIIKS